MVFTYRDGLAFLAGIGLFFFLSLGGKAQALPVTYLGPLVEPRPIADQKVPAIFPTLVLVSEHLIGSPMGPIMAMDPL
ncbi:hypothetical protein HYT05_01330 [Candidatus Kaiserbacteria bacterium]|nr:hypothetical protein [Candidatus Kaiserbacteria bacterium]